MQSYCEKLTLLLNFYENINNHKYDKHASREHVITNSNLITSNFYYFKILKEYKDSCHLKSKE